MPSRRVFFGDDSNSCYVKICEHCKTKKNNNSFCVFWDKVASAMLACTVRYLPCEE